MSNFKFTWGHGVALALGSFIIFILTLIYLGQDTGDLVTDHYYEHALTYQEDVIDAEKNVNELPVKPKIVEQANGILLTFPDDLLVESGEIVLTRGAYRATDIRIPIQLRNHEILIPAHKLSKGDYDMTITWNNQGKKYLIKKNLQWNPPS